MGGRGGQLGLVEAETDQLSPVMEMKCEAIWVGHLILSGLCELAGGGVERVNEL